MCRLLAILLVPIAAGCAYRPLAVTELQGGALATMRAVEEIRALQDPALLPGRDAGSRLRRGQRVVGFVVGDMAVAIALPVLDTHEIVNLQRSEWSDGELASGVAATW